MKKLFFLTCSCQSFAEKPKFEMLLTQVTLLSARETGAFENAPINYTQGEKFFIKARLAYKLKDFKNAKRYILHALKLAERAEYQSLQKNQMNSKNIEQNQ